MLLPSLLLAFTIAQQPQAKPFEFKDGDRIVWIGNTFVEREQRYGCWESALLAANKDKKITLRNLGWSGDTVYGDARAGFDNAAKGFERLVSLALELKPTVIFVYYGTNEAFEGKEGLGKFEKGLEKLLDALAPAKARIVLFTPLPFEIHKNFPASAARNQVLAEYAEVIRGVAKKRQLYLGDLFAIVSREFATIDDLRSKGVVTDKPVTENGMHLTEQAYREGYVFLMDALGLPSFKSYSEIDKLRDAVVEKNQLFFYRWRPQNETYLFGFRKHEQGKNAKEVAEFDPLVDKAEDEIHKILKNMR